MTIYAGLDVSDKTVHVCVVDAEGAVLHRDVVATDPDVLAKWLRKRCPGLVRVVLETGPLSTYLHYGLVERGKAGDRSLWGAAQSVLLGYEFRGYCT
jgi:transposase